MHCPLRHARGGLAGARVKVMRHVHFGDPSPRRRREALDLAAEGGPPSRPGGAPLEVSAPPPSLRDRALPRGCTPHKLGT